MTYIEQLIGLYEQGCLNYKGKELLKELLKKANNGLRKDIEQEKSEIRELDKQLQELKDKEQSY